MLLNLIMIFKYHRLHCLARVLCSRRAVPCEMFRRWLMWFRCWSGWKFVSLALRCFISLILLSQNLEPQVFRCLRCWISRCSSAWTDWEAWLLRGVRIGEGGWWRSILQSEASSCELWLSQERSSLARPSKRPPAKVLRQMSELEVPDPLQLFGANLRALMSECAVPTTRSDSRSDRSEMAWRLTLSFLLLLSQFSMIPSNLSLNLRRVSISISCCAFSSFCFWMSSRQSSICLWIIEFSRCRDYIRTVSAFDQKMIILYIAWYGHYEVGMEKLAVGDVRKQGVIMKTVVVVLVKK